MTERFTETISTGIVTDNKTGKEYNCEMRINDDFLNLVNTIAKENEQLKSKNRGLQSELQIFKEDVTHSNLQINKLTDENEKLKEEIKDLNDVLARYEEKELQE